MGKSKKVLTAEERVKKYSKDIKCVGILYLVWSIITIFMQASLLLNPVYLIMCGLQIVVLLGMIKGGSEKSELAVKAGWIFEWYMIISSILSLLLVQRGPDLIGLLVMIWLPSDIKGLSKALKELNSTNQEYTTTNN